jgi:hypothetical protein
MQPLRDGEKDHGNGVLPPRLSNIVGVFGNVVAILLGASYYASELSRSIDNQVMYRAKRSV